MASARRPERLPVANARVNNLQNVRISAKRQKSPLVFSPEQVKLGLAELHILYCDARSIT
jgi:hypothetical protein